jgi:hypothetical protein
MRRFTVLLACLLFCPTLLSAQTTWYVPDDFPTIQGALASGSVVDTDTIIVRPGTYVENINFLGKAVTLKSELGPEVTIIDGKKAGSVATCRTGEGADTVLQGFTLFNGSGTPTHAGLFGGGMYNLLSTPTVFNCHFIGNRRRDVQRFRQPDRDGLQAQPELRRRRRRHVQQFLEQSDSG